MPDAPMSPLLIAACVLAGGLLLYGGAEALVRGSAALSLRLGISPLIVGLTVVAFVTSSPELLVSVIAALNGSTQLALGNVVGSNICNIGLILGVACLIRPTGVNKEIVLYQIPILILASLVLVLMVLNGRVSRPEGALLVIGVVAFTLHGLRRARSPRPAVAKVDFEEVIPAPRSRAAVELSLIVIGLAALVGGGELFVRGALGLAERLGVSEMIIGLTLAALGTSLPELATSIVAASRNHGDIAIGNIVGSSIFNIFGILGITALITPVDASGLGLLDIPVLLFLTFLLLPIMWSGYIITRLEAGLLCLVYLAYMTFLMT